MRISLHIIRRSLNALLCVLCVFALVSCEDFFYSEVPYKGDRSDQKLVVNAIISNGEIPSGIHVSHSFFVFDSAQYVTIYDSIYYAETDEYYLVGYEDRSRGWLSDADVSVQIGQSAPVKCAYNETYSCYYPLKEDGTPTAYLSVNPGDTVLLHVSHPVYGEAYARQVQPFQAKGEVTDYSFNDFGQIYFTLVIEPYEGADDDVISISYRNLLARGSVTSDNKNFIDEKYNYRFTEDYTSPMLYSLDPAFAQLSNKQTSSGYYGGRSLCLPATALRNGLSLQCIADPHLESYSIDETSKVVYDSLDWYVQFTSQTVDHYRYLTSYEKVSGNDYSPIEPSHVLEESSYNIFDEISEIFDELGGAEEYLLYGNFYSHRPSDKTEPTIAVPDVFGQFSLTNTYIPVYYEYRK